MDQKNDSKKQKIKNKLTTKFFYLVWLICLIVFLTCAFFSETFNNLMLIAVLVGIFAFIFLFHRLSRPKIYTNKNFGSLTLLTILTFFVILFNFQKVSAFLGFPVDETANQRVHLNNLKPPSVKPTMVPTLIPSNDTDQVKNSITTNSETNANLIDCIGPDGKEFKTTMNECKNLNEKWSKEVDYIVNCNLASCGGGIIRMSKSECNNACDNFYKVNNDFKPSSNNSDYNFDLETYPVCTIYYPSLNKTETYYYFTKEECARYQEQANSYSSAFDNTTGTETNQNDSGLINCVGINNVSFGDLTFKECCEKICYQAYEIEKNNVINSYGTQSGTYEFIIRTQVEPEYQSCLNNCN